MKLNSEGLAKASLNECVVSLALRLTALQGKLIKHRFPYFLVLDAFAWIGDARIDQFKNAA
jgi:hypothetical protein